MVPTPTTPLQDRDKKLIHFAKLPLLSYSQKIQPMEISASVLNHEIKIPQSQDCRVLGGRPGILGCLFILPAY